MEGKTIGYGKRKDEREDLNRFLESVRNSDISIGKAKKSPITGSTVAVLTTPVMEKGKKIGILCLALSLDSISDLLVANARLGKEGYISIVENDGRVIAHINKNLILNLDISKQSFGAGLLSMREGEIMDFVFGGQKRFATLKRLEKWKLSVAAIQPLHEITNSLNKLVLGIIIISLLTASVSAYVLYRVLNNRLRPLESVSKVFRTMSEGDLRCNLNSSYQDEIGMISGDMNSFIQNLSKSIKNVQQISLDLSSSANQLTTSSLSFATVAQSTAASSEEMSATTEEMSAAMDQISEKVERQYRNIREFHSKIKSLSQGSRQIGKEIQNTLKKSNMISEKVKTGEESLNSMGTVFGTILKSSEQMTGIIKIINEIADQTQLLSLNASIEAARAGDAGRGFAIVADEISKLSEKTTSSIKSISGIIGGNRSGLSNGIDGIQITLTTLREIIQTVEEVAVVMEELFQITKTQDHLSSEVDLESDRIGEESEAVKLAIEEQKRAVREITNVISKLNDETLGTASSSEEVSATSVSLSNNAEILKRITDKFQVA